MRALIHSVYRPECRLDSVCGGVYLIVGPFIYLCVTVKLKFVRSYLAFTFTSFSVTLNTIHRSGIVYKLCKYFCTVFFLCCVFLCKSMQIMRLFLRCDPVQHFTTDFFLIFFLTSPQRISCQYRLNRWRK